MNQAQSTTTTNFYRAHAAGGITRLLLFFCDKEKNGGAHFHMVNFKNIHFYENKKPTFSLTDKLGMKARNTMLEGKFKTGVCCFKIFARVETGWYF